MGLANQHINILIGQLKRLTNKSIDKEVIHDLRVIVKRLKALWAIHPVANSIPFKKSFPHIRRLFRIGARTRDLQVIETCLFSLPDFSKFPTLAKKIRTEIKMEKKKLDKKMHTASFRHDVLDELKKFRDFYKISSGFLLKTNRKHYRTLVLEHMKTINPRDEDKLHELRKMLKNQIYQSEAFYNHSDNHKDLKDAKTIELLQHQLGYWHDWWNTIQWLYTHELEEQKNNAELIKQVKTKEAALKRELIRNIRAYLLQHTKESS
jgi:CHAD domain-containing protein